MRPLRLTTAFIVTLGGVLLGMAFLLAGCSGGSEEEGRIRVTSAQVVGIYELKLDKGSERLELQADGTFLQDTISKSKPFHHTGKWSIENHWFDGSDVVLINAAIVSWPTPGSEDPPLGFGGLLLRAHNRASRVALARNEVADWYYERTQ